MSEEIHYSQQCVECQKKFTIVNSVKCQKKFTIVNNVLNVKKKFTIVNNVMENS